MRLVVICVTLCAVLGLFLAFNYNRFDARDWQTILGTITAAAGALLGFDKIKSRVTGECNSKDETQPNDNVEESQE